MKISVFGKAMSIRELGGVADNSFTIHFAGVDEGTEVMLKETSGKYALATVKDSRTTFPATLLTDGGRYSISLKNNDGIVLSVDILYSNCVFRLIHKSVDEELTAMWEAIMSMADIVSSVSEEMNKLICGFKTE